MAFVINNLKNLTGTGVKGTIPSPADLLPNQEGYLPTDLQMGEWAYNIDDKIYYTRTTTGIQLLYDPGYYKTADQIDKYDPTKTYAAGEYVSFQIGDEPQIVVSVEITGASGEDANGIIQATASGAGEDYVFYLDGTDRKNTTGFFDGLVIGSYILIITTPDQKYIETLEFQIPDTGLSILSIEATVIDYFTPGTITCLTEGGSGELTYKLIPTGEVNATGIFNVTEPGDYQVLVNEQVLSEVVNIQRNQITSLLFEYTSFATANGYEIISEPAIYNEYLQLVNDGEHNKTGHYYLHNGAIKKDGSNYLSAVLSLLKDNGVYNELTFPTATRQPLYTASYIDMQITASGNAIGYWNWHFRKASFYVEIEGVFPQGGTLPQIITSAVPLSFRFLPQPTARFVATYNPEGSLAYSPGSTVDFNTHAIFRITNTRVGDNLTPQWSKNGVPYTALATRVWTLDIDNTPLYFQGDATQIFKWDKIKAITI